MATNVKYLKGTSDIYQEHAALNLITDLNFYYLTDTGDLYLGATKLSNEKDLQNALYKIIGSYTEAEEIPSIKDLELMICQQGAELEALNNIAIEKISWGKVK